MSLLNAPCHLSPGILSNRWSGQVLGLWLGQAPPASQTSNLLTPQLASSLGQSRSSTGTTCSLKGVGSSLQLSFNHRAPVCQPFPTTSLITCLYAPSRVRQQRQTRPEPSHPHVGALHRERVPHSRAPGSPIPNAGPAVALPGLPGMDPGLPGEAVKT